MRKLLVGDPPGIRITDHDLERLDALLSSFRNRPASPVIEFLQQEVDRAGSAEGQPPDQPFVKLGSQVEFRDEDTGRVLTATLCFPGQGEGIADAVSLLTPVGSALLGLSPGQSIAYDTPDGRTKTITIQRVTDPAV